MKFSSFDLPNFSAQILKTFQRRSSKRFSENLKNFDDLPTTVTIRCSAVRATQNREILLPFNFNVRAKKNVERIRPLMDRIIC